MDSSLYLIELGQYAAYLAMVVALVQALAPVAARVFGVPRLAAISLNAAVAVFALTTMGAATIIHSFVASRFFRFNSVPLEPLRALHTDTARRQRSESATARSGDGDSPADALFRLRRILSAVCVRDDGANHALAQRVLDRAHPALGASCVGISHHGHHARRLLGVLRARLGRLLGVGP